MPRRSDWPGSPCVRRCTARSGPVSSTQRPPGSNPPAAVAKISRRQLRGSLQTGVLAPIVAPELPGKDLPTSDGAQRAAGPYRARSGLLERIAGTLREDLPASAARIAADGRPGRRSWRQPAWPGSPSVRRCAARNCPYRARSGLLVRTDGRLYLQKGGVQINEINSEKAGCYSADSP